jgi:predicted Zn-dependent peptidase
MASWRYTTRLSMRSNLVRGVAPLPESADRYHSHVFPNGLTLLIERMPAVRSAAMNLLVPCGAATDPANGIGTANVLGEMTLRGAGKRNSRELSDHLDRLGLQRSMSTGLYHTRYSAAAVASRVLEGLDVYADIVQRPLLPTDEFEAARDLAVQALEGIDDDPRSKVLIQLRQCHWPAPFNRNSMGEKAHLEALDAAACAEAFSSRFGPRGSILALAGDVDPEKAVAQVERCFGRWTAPSIEPHAEAQARIAYRYETQASEQAHIGIACDTVPETHEDYYVARVAGEVLSGGMSGRLFTEIREKRGLCYSVGVSYTPLRDRASFQGYAGTSVDRAQATLDAFVAEMQKLSDGVTHDEVERAKVGLRSSTIMSGESSPARTSAIAGDYFTRGRVRSLDDIEHALAAVNVDRVNEFVKANPLKDFTIVIIGPKELTIPA